MEAAILWLVSFIINMCIVASMQCNGSGVTALIPYVSDYVSVYHVMPAVVIVSERPILCNVYQCITPFTEGLITL